MEHHLTPAGTSEIHEVLGRFTRKKQATDRNKISGDLNRLDPFQNAAGHPICSTIPSLSFLCALAVSRYINSGVMRDFEGLRCAFTTSLPASVVGDVLPLIHYSVIINIFDETELWRTLLLPYTESQEEHPYLNLRIVLGAIKQETDFFRYMLLFHRDHPYILQALEMQRLWINPHSPRGEALLRLMATHTHTVDSSIFKANLEKLTTVITASDTMPIFRIGGGIASLSEFRQRLDQFSEGQLQYIDWSNVVLAGGAVLACLLEPYDRALFQENFRSWRHRHFKRADLDLFLYGLDTTGVDAKVRQIFAAVRRANPRVCCIRTPNTLTLFSELPYLNVQIICTVYMCPEEVLLHFDLDCVTAAYGLLGGAKTDGSGREDAVMVQPRWISALFLRANVFDTSLDICKLKLSRFEKYAKRGYSVLAPLWNRSSKVPFGGQMKASNEAATSNNEVEKNLEHLLIVEAVLFFKQVQHLNEDGYARQLRAVGAKNYIPIPEFINDYLLEKFIRKRETAQLPIALPPHFRGVGMYESVDDILDCCSLKRTKELLRRTKRLFGDSTDSDDIWMHMWSCDNVRQAPRTAFHIAAVGGDAQALHGGENMCDAIYPLKVNTALVPLKHARQSMTWKVHGFYRMVAGKEPILTETELCGVPWKVVLAGDTDSNTILLSLQCLAYKATSESDTARHYYTSFVVTFHNNLVDDSSSFLANIFTPERDTWSTAIFGHHLCADIPPVQLGEARPNPETLPPQQLFITAHEQAARALRMHTNEISSNQHFVDPANGGTLSMSLALSLFTPR